MEQPTINNSRDLIRLFDLEFVNRHSCIYSEKKNKMNRLSLKNYGAMY